MNAEKYFMLCERYGIDAETSLDDLVLEVYPQAPLGNLSVSDKLNVLEEAGFSDIEITHDLFGEISE